MGAFEADKFRAELERDGLEMVKEKLARRLYGDGKRQYAEKWVAEKEQQIATERYEQDHKTPRHKTLPGIIVIAVFTGLCVIYLSYRFGWH